MMKYGMKKILTEYWEFVPFLVVEANQVVDDRSEYNRGQSGGWELGEYLGPEISAYFVHAVVSLPQKHGSLVREDQNDILNCVETHRHHDEE